MRKLLQKLGIVSESTKVIRVEASDLGICLVQENADAICFSWPEIIQIDAFKADLITHDTVVLEFTLRSPDRVILVSEDLDEFEIFVRFLNQKLPSIPADWRARVVQPAFKENRLTLFKASK